MTIDPHYPFAAEIPGQLVRPDKLTPFNDVQLASGLRLAHAHVFDDELSRRPLCCLAAQVKLETGNGKFTHWWNIGNVKGSDSYRGSVCYFRCNEIIDGKTRWFNPFHPQCRFRAYATLAGGCEQQIRFLGLATRGAGKPNRYAAAWSAAMAGDPYGFVDELARAGYFTANVTTYRRAVVQLFQQLLSSLPSMLPDDTHDHEPVVLQETDGHSPTTDLDLKERIEHLQIPLEVDWDEHRRMRDAMIREEDS